MAQAEEVFDDVEPGSEEPGEMERLLEATKQEEEDPEAPPEEKEKFLFSKKFWFLVGGVLLLLIVAVGAYFYLYSSPDPAEVPEAAPPPPVVEPAKPTFDKVHIYTLKPFFLPLKVNDVETGKFISVVPNFILSNSTLNEEIEETLPAIRRNIYNILIRKSPRDYFLKKGKIEEEIKRDILTGVNPLLLAGTGTINDVVFTQFVVK